MDIFTDEAEFRDVRVVQRVVDMFEGHPCLQSIVTYSLSALEYDYGPDRGEDSYGSWARDHRNYNEYPRLADRGLGGNHSRLTRTQPRLNYCVPVRDLTCQPAVKEEEKESDTERKARLLQESKKTKEKAKKKQLKKQKQRERKRREKLEKEKQNPVTDEQRKDDAQQTEAEKSAAANDQYTDNSSSSDKLLGAAKHADTSSDSSDEDSDSNNDSDDLEELDMTSTFVSKAALIAKRQLEQKSKSERKERKKIPDKEHKTVPEKPNEDLEVEKKDSAATNSLTFEDNVKISTDFAIIGNKFASTGDFNMAVKYFTDAIKYNPTEFKLFGNRSFCFEKLQEYDKALTDAELSLGICPGWVKGLFRKGRALAGLKRYEEAAQAFRDVLKLESSYAEASQELMRVQITQLMEYGYTGEQSSNALIIHGTVEKALEVLSKLNCRPGAIQNSTLQHVSGVSPVLSANTKHAPLPAAAGYQAPPRSQDAVIKTPFNRPLGPVQNTTGVQSQPKPVYTQPMKSNNGDNRTPPELFPVWVGNLNHPVTELMITKLFATVGVVHSVKLLTIKRCAFVNFTKQVSCDEAIRNLHGVDLNGNKIAVRYPDRIPPGMGISRSALRADDLQDENVRHSESVDGRNPAGNRRFVRPHKPLPDYRGNH